MNKVQMELKSFYENYAREQIAPEAVHRDSAGSFCYDTWKKLADTGFFVCIFLRNMVVRA